MEHINEKAREYKLERLMHRYEDLMVHKSMVEKGINECVVEIQRLIKIDLKKHVLEASRPVEKGVRYG